MTASRLLAGASGYSFKEWKGTSIPRRSSPRTCWRYYAERLPTVEINNTFYRMPKTSVLENWAERDARRTSASRSRRRAASRTSRGSRRSRRPSRSAYLYTNLAALGAKRGPVLFQLPPNLKKDLPRLDGVPRPAARRITAPRSSSATTRWFADDVYDALKAAGAALCLSEREDNAPPPLVETAPWGYVRLRLENYSDADLQAVGAQARGHVVARDLRVLHARADGAGVRAGADAIRELVSCERLEPRIAA